MTGKYPRPTAPHLQIYRLPLTALISITHRITGVFLSAGLLLIIAILYGLTLGETHYLVMQEWSGFWLGKLVFWGFIFALFFHLCHGVRHLIWDLGESFSLETLNVYALLELIAAIALTLGALLF